MKINTKDRASLIRLTLFDLNKKGLVFAGFLLAGLVFVVVLSWFTLQEANHKPQTSFSSTEPSTPLATPTGLKTSDDSTSFERLEAEMMKNEYKQEEEILSSQLKWKDERLRSRADIWKKASSSLRASSTGKVSPDEFKHEMELQEYNNLYQKEFKKYDEQHQQILKDYEDYKFSTFPKLDKSQLPKDEGPGLLGSMKTWWKGIYGDVEKRDKRKERRRLRSTGKK